MQTLRITLAIILLLAAIPLSIVADENSTATSTGIEQLIADLGAVSFTTRLAAAQRMSELPISDLQLMAALSDSELTPEISVRLLKELELRYSAEGGSDVDAASEILESLRTSKRLLLADMSQRILKEHWRTRISLAKRDLEAVGAKFMEGSFSSRQEFRWLPGADMPSVQVLIGENWKGGIQGLRIIERLSVLTDHSSKISGVHVWLLEGHSLSDAEYSVLSDLVGQDRIQERSRVALGIRGMQGIANGVVIEAITTGSSAADAGLQRYDQLLAIVEPIPATATREERTQLEENQKLRDFDDLVERLKQFREGDVIKLKVVRGLGRIRMNPFGPEPNPGPVIPSAEEIISVTLKGWDKLPVHPN